LACTVDASGGLFRALGALDGFPSGIYQLTCTVNNRVAIRARAVATARAAASMASQCDSNTRYDNCLFQDLHKNLLFNVNKNNPAATSWRQS
jgi:hypothetical protein